MRVSSRTPKGDSSTCPICSDEFLANLRREGIFHVDSSDINAFGTARLPPVLEEELARQP